MNILLILLNVNQQTWFIICRDKYMEQCALCNIEITGIYILTIYSPMIKKEYKIYASKQKPVQL